MVKWKLQQKFIFLIPHEIVLELIKRILKIRAFHLCSQVATNSSGADDLEVYELNFNKCERINVCSRLLLRELRSHQHTCSFCSVKMKTVDEMWRYAIIRRIENITLENQWYSQSTM